ncbi:MULTISPECIES: hypothetical protein [Pseudoalteromonas]|uniref:hypothetical protein n=1 Tax=Pseudoalteromonas TaxID=53246 RepID=UPI0003460C05|nr:MULTISPECIES: hypothetical protein [Pseudoalteromonas]MCF2862756.1 hypothetical protein [Pseudoalteromonas sp. CNAT2-18]MCG7543344.1 hypothetical protein [Pseudoalteromonas sp. MM17-2]MCG7558792.1 hypothetical protein [Pseudoalteromonas sp. CNAT2-18.1]MCG7570628.1 hypothetical protein [Pseudoalteromonas sp. CNC9-20]QFU05866.1 hypothetical protein FIU82_12810 [Pseudoalteromonas sp. THAF3]|tara:strand:+ start:1449 stop:1940 length:492 start_codon:yes stop_codon:yes gene_type:complete
MAAIKLSRKGWNNLIIFAMLIMIFVFNGLHHRLGGDDEPKGPQPLLPAQSYILTLEYPGIKIERIGTSWRMQQDSDAAQPSADIQTLEANVRAWQQQRAPLAEPLGGAPLLAATLTLAGEPTPYVYVLYKDQQHYRLFNKQQQRWYSLTTHQAQQLFIQLASN